MVHVPPVYTREVWDFSKANIGNINKAISNFNWTKAFENLSVDEKVEVLNETLVNIYRNYISSKKIKCDYRQPPWITKNVKKPVKGRSKLTKIFYKSGQRKTDHEKVLEKATQSINEILEAKKNYILKMSKKLEDSHTAPKVY